MILVDFSQAKLKIKTQNEVNFVFDEQRKKWFVLNPEEWVRQHLIQFFVNHCGYPAKYIAVEKQIIVNGQKKRYDIVIYNSVLIPWMLIECKEPDVVLNDDTLQQVLSYQLVLNANYVVVSNGKSTYLFTKQTNGKVEALTEWPIWI